MKVFPENALIKSLQQVVDLSGRILPHLRRRGTSPVDPDMRTEFEGLLETLSSYRGEDSRLDDESWGWIFEGKDQYTYLQVYGRLAWINLQLLDLL